MTPSDKDETPATEPESTSSSSETSSGGILATRAARADALGRNRLAAPTAAPEPPANSHTLYLDVLRIAQEAGGTPEEVLARADAYHEHLKEIEHG